MHKTAQILLTISVLATSPLMGQTIAEDANDAQKAWLTAADAGPAFAVQGEYAGVIKTDNGEVKLGVQVIAEGDGKLAWVAYFGGLPGDGWDGMLSLRGNGEMQGTAAVLEAENGRAEIRDGSLVAFTLENVRVGELPRVIRVSPTMGRKPPEGAVVLFDGSTAAHFEGGKMTEDKLLMQGVTSKEKFSSCEVHLEFLLSFMPHARGQGRSNSGCYLQGRYEVQILDSFGLAGENNECGGIYSIRKPTVNMCYPPLGWQTYDIEFHAAKFDETRKKTADAWMTVRHNGVVIHDRVNLPHATTAAPLAEGPEPGPLYLQDHGNPVRFRNIWVRTIQD